MEFVLSLASLAFFTSRVMFVITEQNDPHAFLPLVCAAPSCIVLYYIRIRI